MPSGSWPTAWSGGSNLEMIGYERDRQKTDLGFDPAHDDQHDAGELAVAAACYAAASFGISIFTAELQGPIEFRFEDAWPWHGNDDHRTRDHEGEIRVPGYNTTDPAEKIMARKRLLQKAGALILAEMDRLDREFIYGANEALNP